MLGLVDQVLRPAMSHDALDEAAADAADLAGGVAGNDDGDHPAAGEHDGRAGQRPL